MPECIRIVGVPTAPAERMISLDAVAVNKEVPVMIMISKLVEKE
jgi:hypothetical protein